LVHLTTDIYQLVLINWGGTDDAGNVEDLGSVPCLAHYRVWDRVWSFGKRNMMSGDRGLHFDMVASMTG